MFVGLHNHTAMGSNTRGFLDSTNRVEDMILYSQQLGHRGIAFTDHDCITAHMDALDCLKALRDPGSDYYKNQTPDFSPDDWQKFKVILGNEIYLCSRKQIQEDKLYKFWHFILLAKDEVGHQQIRELSTRAWTDNSFTWVNIRTPTFYDDLFEVVEGNRGHLMAATACLGGFLPHLVLNAYAENPEGPNLNEAQKWLQRMDQCFGHGNFFLEMQPSVQEDQRIVNKIYLKLSKELDIPYIITTDAHYLKQEDRPIHEAFLRSNEDSGKDREVGEFYATTYIMSEAEIHGYLDESLGAEAVQRGLENTMLVWAQVGEYSLDKPLEIPYEPDDVTEPSEELFNKYSPFMEHLAYFYNSEHPSDRHLVREIVNKIESQPEELANQKTYEAIDTCLKVIENTSKKMNTRWSAYLIQTRAFVDAIWACDSIAGPSRGSGGGFILLYILGITQINPLREETPLYYWRFLHEFRASVLDIDLDCDGNKRDDIVKYLQNKYGGFRRVFKVQTLLTVKAKNAILIAARGLGVTPEEAQFLSSFIGQERGIQHSLKQTFYGDDKDGIPPNAEFANLMSTKYSKLWEVAQRIEGLVVGVGQHAGGVVLSPDDVINHTALMKAGSGDIITQNDLHKIERENLIKWDVLGVDYCGKIKICLELLAKHGYIEWQGSLKDTYEKYLGVYNIERDNPEIWDMIDEHKIVSLFQMEKQTGIQAIEIAKPRSLVDLSALNSVMRLMAPEPGAESPLERFGRFKKDIRQWYQEMTNYGLNEHEQAVVRKYAENTYGLLPNQENFMIAVQDPEIAGFDLLWADRLRKSIAKKNPKDYAKLQEEFYQNSAEKKLSSKLCHYVWDVLIAMNRGYGF